MRPPLAGICVAWAWMAQHICSWSICLVDVSSMVIRRNPPGLSILIGQPTNPCVTHGLEFLRRQTPLNRPNPPAGGCVVHCWFLIAILLGAVESWALRIPIRLRNVFRKGHSWPPQGRGRNLGPANRPALGRRDTFQAGPLLVGNAGLISFIRRSRPGRQSFLSWPRGRCDRRPFFGRLWPGGPAVFEYRGGRPAVFPFDVMMGPFSALLVAWRMGDGPRAPRQPAFEETIVIAEPAIIKSGPLLTTFPLSPGPRPEVKHSERKCSAGVEAAGAGAQRRKANFFLGGCCVFPVGRTLLSGDGRCQIVA